MVSIHNTRIGNCNQNTKEQTDQGLIWEKLKGLVLCVLFWNETLNEEELECIVEDIVAAANGSTNDS